MGKLDNLFKRWPWLINVYKALGAVGIIWGLKRTIYIYHTFKQYMSRSMILKLLFIIAVLYVAYHCIAVHRFLTWHKQNVKKIIQRAKMKEKNGILPQNILDETYSESVSQEQFDSNMKYFANNRDKRGGFFPINPVMEHFSESCTFLGGGRAALLQVAHPFVAISVKKHSYIIKRSKMKHIAQKNADLEHHCPYSQLSKALKLRFNRTFAVLFPIMYGPLDKSLFGAKVAWSMHKKTKGQLLDDNENEIIGDGKLFNKNTYYSATMTLPLRWVWGTLIETAMFTNQLMGLSPYKDITPNQTEFIEKWYQASFNTAMAFGLTKQQVPKTLEEFEEWYWYKMVESKHIEVCNDCSKWSKVFFMTNNWYKQPLNYALKSYTAMIFPETVRNKFNKYDPELLPVNTFIYFYGLLWLGLSRGLYTLLPKSARLLNDYMNLKERTKEEENEKPYNKLQNTIKTISGYVANHIVHTFIEG